MLTDILLPREQCSARYSYTAAAAAIRLVFVTELSSVAASVDTDAPRWWSFIAPCLGDH